MPYKICLCMIVKNEAHVIKRCIDSVLPFIDSWLVVDTGSTDGTQEFVRYLLKDLPGMLVERPWINFAVNRSEALQEARRVADNAFVIDADEVLQLPEDFRMSSVLTHAAYSLDVKFGSMVYSRTCIFSSKYPWHYVGALHEYPECGQKVYISHMKGPSVVVHTDGARSKNPQKYADDAKLLEAEVNARNMFYLAQSYRDAGENEKALNAYLTRAGMAGWDEEKWYSLYQAAVLAERLARPESEVISRYLAAYDFRPTRAESLTDLARYLRLKKQFASAVIFAQRAMNIEMSKDILFVDSSHYMWRARDEFAVSSYWSGNKKGCEFICRELLADDHLPADQRARVEANLKSCLS